MFSRIQLSSVLTLAALVNLCASAALDSVQRCRGTVVRTNLIGSNNNVVLETVLCASDAVRTPNFTIADEKDSNNICGAKCDTNCFSPSGGGPDPNHCQVIADAILYDSENDSEWFDLPNGTQPTSVYKFRTCEAFIVNQSGKDLTYCRSDMAGVIQYLAFNCQSDQNAHGGNCVADDKRWFVQVQTKP